MWDVASRNLDVLASHEPYSPFTLEAPDEDMLDPREVEECRERARVARLNPTPVEESAEEAPF